MVTLDVHDKRPTKRAMRTADMRRRIIDESVKLFVEQGYEKTTTRQILQRVGILNGSLYNIYKSKEDIFADIILNAMRDVIEQATPVMPEKASAPMRLAVILDIQLYLCSKSPRVAELPTIAHGRWDIHRRVTDQLTDWLGRMDVNGDLHIGTHDFSMRLDACTAVCSAFIQRMSSEPETVDLRQAMLICTKGVLGIMGGRVADAEPEVDALLQRLEGMEFVVCDMRL